MVNATKLSEKNLVIIIVLIVLGILFFRGQLFTAWQPFNDFSMPRDSTILVQYTDMISWTNFEKFTLNIYNVGGCPGSEVCKPAYGSGTSGKQEYCRSMGCSYNIDQGGYCSSGTCSCPSTTPLEYIKITTPSGKIIFNQNTAGYTDNFADDVNSKCGSLTPAPGVNCDISLNVASNCNTAFSIGYGERIEVQPTTTTSTVTSTTTIQSSTTTITGTTTTTISGSTTTTLQSSCYKFTGYNSVNLPVCVASSCVNVCTLNMGDQACGSKIYNSYQNCYNANLPEEKSSKWWIWTIAIVVIIMIIFVFSRRKKG